MSSMGCEFCFSNGKSVEECLSHSMRTSNGVVSCPLLRSIVCPHRKTTGNFAHTERHCPFVIHSASARALGYNQKKELSLLSKHQQCMEFYRKKWMEHQAEINRLQALRKVKAGQEQDWVYSQPSLCYYPTINPTTKALSPELHYIPGNNGNKMGGQSGKMVMVEDWLAQLREKPEKSN